jgi:small subunit ribosomal protein S9
VTEDENVESADTDPTGTPAPEPVADAASGGGAEAPAAEPVPAAEPPAPEPAADPVPEPAADAVPEAAADPVPEPAADAVPEAAADAVPEPAVDAVPEPVADAVPEPSPPGVAAAGGAPAPESTPEAGEIEVEELDLAPRARPEIPGADLVPDLVSETDEFLDAEARAAAEAEAEAAAARESEEDPDAVAQPIADAAIDLAAGARYTATGKRKTAVARVILKPGTGTYSINGKPLDVFFPRDTLQRVIRHPLETVGYESRMDVVARMHGGGVAAQAGALRHGISRALLEADPNLRGELKRRGFLTRDPRVKERKKAGLKKARKRPQFSKR